jgi:hypothetical protein
MKQTAVEKLENLIYSYCRMTGIGNEMMLINVKSFEYIIQQAKEMEKEQMQDLFKAGVNYGAGYVIATEQGEENTKPNFYNYYNETFKSE